MSFLKIFELWKSSCHPKIEKSFPFLRSFFFVRAGKLSSLRAMLWKSF
jgi:hypothetical protein